MGLANLQRPPSAPATSGPSRPVGRGCSWLDKTLPRGHGGTDNDLGADSPILLQEGSGSTQTMTAATQPYPDNSRSEWVRRWLVEPVYGLDGLLRFAYEVSARAGEKPFLLNSHKAMVRETHQRIRLNAPGEMMHMSGIAVPELDVEEFLLTDRRGLRWGDPWQGVRRGGGAPLIFRTPC